jgi:photosystem II stability/assembly factor-like uncharacterized protein
VTAVVVTADGGTSWHGQHIPAVQGLFLESIDCAGVTPAVRCWASGATSDVGVLLRTENGGAAWSRQRLPSGTVEVKEVQTVGPVLGWALAPSSETNDWVIATRSGGRPAA